MKIALIISAHDFGLRGLDAYAIYRGASYWLTDHEMSVFSANEVGSDTGLTQLKRHDFVVWCAPEYLPESSWCRLLDDSRYRPLDGRTLVMGAWLSARWMASISETAQATLRQWLRTGSITVSDFESQRLLGSLGESAVSVTSFPSYFCMESGLSCRSTSNLVCPPSELQESSGRSASFSYCKFCSELSDREKTLFLAEREGDFAWGAVPGLNTLIATRYPSHATKAVASAGVVYSSRPHPALVAAANGVAALGITLGVDDSRLSSAAIPQMSLSLAAKPKEWRDGARAILNAYPWDEIRERRRQFEAATRDWLKERGLLSPARGSSRPSKEEAGAPLHVCSISDVDYAPFLMGFIENLKQVHSGSITFHILTLDDKVAPLLKEQFPKDALELYALSDLWEAGQLPSILERGRGDRAFSTKPKLIAAALRKAKGPVIYSDCDVYFFASPVGLTENLKERPILLFPHWNDQFPEARLDGLFNAGMIAVAPGAEKFLAWWGDLCARSCSVDEVKGVVGDQGYLDFVPILFPESDIYRDGDYDVARWNLATLGVSFPKELPGIPRLGDGKPVRCYHAAFVDSKGIFEIKYCWDQLVAFHSTLGHARPQGLLRSMILTQQSNHWIALGRARLLRTKLSQWLGLKRKYLGVREARFWVLGMGSRWLNFLARLSRISGRLKARCLRAPLSICNQNGVSSDWKSLQGQGWRRLQDEKEIRSSDRERACYGVLRRV